MDSNETDEYMYVMENQDWKDKFKYGYTKNLVNRLGDHNGYHSKLTDYIYICKLKKEPTYKLYKEFDKLFSIGLNLSLIHISEPTRRTPISYAVFCLKKKRPG